MRRPVQASTMVVNAIAYGITVFLLLPTVLIVPMSFGPDQFLRFPPSGFTLHWYATYFADADWVDATLFSVRIALLTALVATVIGTLVSIALVRGRLPFKPAFELLVVGPVIVPNIALAIAMFLVFDRLRLTGTTFGFVMAHTALAMPFVVFTILASLYRFDADLERAALSCGASPLQAFRLVTLPQISPGIVSAALFAFIISFDEPVISFFISDLNHRSLPRKMFEDIDYNISPTLAAVATMLTGLTLLALVVGHVLKRNSVRPDTRKRRVAMNITRRGLMAGAAAAAVLPTVQPAGAAGGEVIIATTGGLMTNSLQAHFYKRFEVETGIKVRAVAIELPDQWARAVAGARSGSVPFDVVTATPPDLIQQADLLQTIDCAGMPGIAAHALPNGCTSKGIIRTVGGMTLTWSKKAFPNGGPQSWTDFFDVAKFPGPRSLPDTGDREWWLPVAALLADGVPRDKLFPLDLDRAYKKLDTIKPHVAAWWKSGDNSMQILRGGDAVMSMLYSSRSVPLAKSGEFDFTWNGAIRDTGNWAVLKGGPNTENGLRFLDFFVQNPAEHLPFSTEVSFDSNNKEAAAQVPAEERRFRSSYPENYEKLIIADYEWIAGVRSKMRERWISWLTQ